MKRRQPMDELAAAGMTIEVESLPVHEVLLEELEDLDELQVGAVVVVLVQEPLKAHQMPRFDDAAVDELTVFIHVDLAIDGPVEQALE